MQPEANPAAIAEAREVLYTLLTSSEARCALRQGTLSSGLSPDGKRALSGTCTEQLERASRLFAYDILRRRRRGAAPLGEQFAKTLEGVDREALVLRFVRSRFFAAHRELPHGPLGLCIEEAFFNFLDEECVGDSATRQLEYLDAAARALLVQPRPAFQIPRPFRRKGDAWVAMGPGRTLFVVANGKLMRGKIAPGR